MITVAILSLATVFISQSNLTSGAVFGRYANRLDIQNWAAQKIWEEKEQILSTDFPDVGSSQGQFEGQNKVYRWTMKIDEEKIKSADLYLLNLKVSWQEGGRPVELERHGGLLKIRK